MPSLRGMQTNVPTLDAENLSWSEYLESLGLNIVFLLQEESGAIINTGDAGSALNGTLQNSPDRVVGPMGGGYDFNASNHGILIADGTAKDAIEASAVQTFSILFRPRGAGPSNSGHIMSYGNADYRLFFNGSMAPRARVGRSTTPANTTASTTLNTNVTQWLHMVYTSDVIRLLRDQGTLQELTYSNQTAGVGTQNSSANALYLGNRQSLTLNTDAEIYAIAYGAVALSDAVLDEIGRLTLGLG